MDFKAGAGSAVQKAPDVAAFDKWIVDRDLRAAFEDNHLIDFLSLYGDGGRLVEDSKRRHYEAVAAATAAAAAASSVAEHKIDRQFQQPPPPIVKRDDDDVAFDSNIEFSDMIRKQAGRLRRLFVDSWYCKLRNHQVEWPNWIPGADAWLARPVATIRKTTVWPPTGDLFPDSLVDKGDLGAAIRVWHDTTIAAMNHGVPMIHNGVVLNHKTKMVTLPLMIVRHDVLPLLMGDIDNHSAVDAGKMPFAEYCEHQHREWESFKSKSALVVGADGKKAKGDSSSPSSNNNNNKHKHCPIPYCVVTPRFQVLDVVGYSVKPLVDAEALVDMTKDEKKEATARIKGLRLKGGKDYAWYRAVANLQAAAIDDAVDRQRATVHRECCGSRRVGAAAAIVAVDARADGDGYDDDDVDDAWRHQPTQAYMVGRGHQKKSKNPDKAINSAVAGDLCLALTDGVDAAKNKIAMDKAIAWWHRVRDATQGGLWDLFPAPSVPELYPNMKASRTDFPWSLFKNKYAKWLRELTCLWYVRFSMREWARTQYGIVAYDDPRLSLEALGCVGRSMGFDQATLARMIAMNQRCCRAIVMPASMPAETKRRSDENNGDDETESRKRKRSEQEEDEDDDDDGDDEKRPKKKAKPAGASPSGKEAKKENSAASAGTVVASGRLVPYNVDSDPEDADSDWEIISEIKRVMGGDSVSAAGSAEGVAGATDLRGMNFPMVPTVQPAKFQSNLFDWRRDPALLYRDRLERLRQGPRRRHRPLAAGAGASAGASASGGLLDTPDADDAEDGGGEDNPPPMVEVCLDFENISHIADPLDSFPVMNNTTGVLMIGITYWDYVKGRKMSEQLIAKTGLGKRAALHELELFVNMYRRLEEIANNTQAALARIKAASDQARTGASASASGLGLGSASRRGGGRGDSKRATDDDEDNDDEDEEHPLSSAVVMRPAGGSSSSSVLASDHVSERNNFKIKVWHYSNAEVVLYESMLRRMRGAHLGADDVHRKMLEQFADRIVWCDMLVLLKKQERFIVRGMLNYGLKSVIRSAHKQGLIKNVWPESQIDNGLSAMVALIRCAEWQQEQERNGYTSAFLEHAPYMPVLRAYLRLDTESLMDWLHVARANW